MWGRGSRCLGEKTVNWDPILPSPPNVVTVLAKPGYAFPFAVFSFASSHFCSSYFKSQLRNHFLESTPTAQPTSHPVA